MDIPEDQISELVHQIEEFSQKMARKAKETRLMDKYQMIRFPKGEKTNEKRKLFEEIRKIDFLFW